MSEELYQGFPIKSLDAFKEAWAYLYDSNDLTLTYCQYCSEPVKGQDVIVVEQRYGKCPKCSREISRFRLNQEISPSKLEESLKVIHRVLLTRFQCKACDHYVLNEMHDETLPRLTTSRGSSRPVKFQYCWNCSSEIRNKLLIPPDFRDCDLATDFPSFKFDESKGYYLWGPVGVGKTRLAYCLVKEHIKKNKDIKVITYIDFVLHCRASYGADNGKKFQELMTRLQNASILVIDDLGGIRDKQVGENEVFNLQGIIDYRCRNNLLTIITSNRSLNDLSENFNPQIASRLYKMCDELEAKGSDKRLQKEDEEQ